jgi:hypothetical protein
MPPSTVTAPRSASKARTRLSAPGVHEETPFTELLTAHRVTATGDGQCEMVAPRRRDREAKIVDGDRGGNARHAGGVQLWMDVIDDEARHRIGGGRQHRGIR